MRITPTQEQVAYLASIGVANAPGVGPGPAVAPSVDAASPPQAVPAAQTSSPVWFIIIALAAIALLVLLLAGIASAQVPVPKVNDAGESRPVDRAAHAADGDETESPRDYRRIGGDVANADAPQNNVAADQIPADPGSSLADLKDQLALLQAHLDERFASISADSSRIADEISALSAENRRLDSRIGTSGRAAAARFEHDRQEINAVAQWLGLAVALTVVLVLIERFLLVSRIRSLEQRAISALSEKQATASSPSAPDSAADKYGTAPTIAAIDLNVAAARPLPTVLPTPTKQMQTIIAAANQFSAMRIKPILSANRWTLGLATMTGNVRSENQDYGLCCRIGDHDVLIVADGCGGVPHGQQAAYLAAVNAAVSVVRAFGMAPRWNAPNAKEVAAKAVLDASHSLAIEGDKLNITDVRGGLRTTLIVVIGNAEKLAYSYIGDGGGCVIKSSGEVVRFLDPQKASALAMNVLAASLGPVMEGEPVTGVLRRDPGDLVIVGTDGVFDRVDSAFPKDVLRGCIQHRGDLQRAAEQIIGELATFQDGAGYICDDNLTLGLMGDGDKPTLPSGFWATTTETSNAFSEVTPTTNATV